MAGTKQTQCLLNGIVYHILLLNTYDISHECCKSNIPQHTSVIMCNLPHGLPLSLLTTCYSHLSTSVLSSPLLLYHKSACMFSVFFFSPALNIIQAFRGRELYGFPEAVVGLGGVCRLGSSTGTDGQAQKLTRIQTVERGMLQGFCAGERIEKYRFFGLNLIHVKIILHLYAIVPLISVFCF